MRRLRQHFRLMFTGLILSAVCLAAAGRADAQAAGGVDFSFCRPAVSDAVFQRLAVEPVDILADRLQ